MSEENETITNSLFDTLANTDFWVGIAASIIISCLLLFLRYKAKQPKLLPNGNGGGSNVGKVRTIDEKRISCYHIGVRSDAFWFGLAINRDKLKVKTTKMYDTQRKCYFGPNMFWRDTKGNLATEIEIEPGDQCQLYYLQIFDGRAFFFSGSYEDESQTLNAMNNSETVIEPNETKYLQFHIQDNIGRLYVLPFKLIANSRNTASSDISVRFVGKRNLHDRWYMFKDGLRSISYALSLKQY